jgi:soluble lytic murein transglycosylase-like protein
VASRFVAKKPEAKKLLVALLAAIGTLGCVIASGQAPAYEPIGSCAPEIRLAVDEVAPEPLTPAQRALVAHLSRRYMVPRDAVAPMVRAAHDAARQVGLDPLLLLAVVAVESSFNPTAQSVVGAKGLMQIIPKFHRARLDEYGGEEAVFDPESNILVGARILQEYVRRTGTLVAGLQFYNGASGDESAAYSRKVFAERARLARVLRDALPKRIVASAETAGG